MKKVLSTKPIDAEADDYARQQHLAVSTIEFIETSALPFDFEALHRIHFDAVAFTSSNAVKFFFDNEAAQEIINNKMVFALEGKTNAELVKNGVKAKLVGKSAENLSEEIIAAKYHNSVLHICGTQTLPVLRNALRHAHIPYHQLVIYQTTRKEVNKTFEEYDVIMFYSPSGVDAFLAQHDFNEHTLCCCIGPTTGAALKEKKHAANIILPNQPSPLAMLQAIVEYYKNHQQ